MDFVIYNSAEDVKAFQNYTKSVADHFKSDVMAEHYLNGYIDWNGRPIGDEEYDY